MKEYRKYLDPDTIAQLGNLELKARLIVEGFITGMHRSPYHGFSVEFSQHRQYRPGDEIRFVDWRVYGRTGRYYVKEFEEETNMSKSDYVLLEGITPLVEEFTGTNAIRYRHIYYVAYATNNKEPKIDTNNTHQMTEIGDIGYFTYNETMNI